VQTIRQLVQLSVLVFGTATSCSFGQMPSSVAADDVPSSKRETWTLAEYRWDVGAELGDVPEVLTHHFPDLLTPQYDGPHAIGRPYAVQSRVTFGGYAGARPVEPPNGRVIVTTEPEGPCAEAGLQTGDVLLKVNGTAFGTTRQLALIVDLCRVHPLEFVVLRRGRVERLQITPRFVRHATKAVAGTDESESRITLQTGRYIAEINFQDEGYRLIATETTYAGHVYAYATPHRYAGTYGTNAFARVRKERSALDDVYGSEAPGPYNVTSVAKCIEACDGTREQIHAAIERLPTELRGKLENLFGRSGTEDAPNAEAEHRPEAE
jgi:hypothetical protein